MSTIQHDGAMSADLTAAEHGPGRARNGVELSDELFDTVALLQALEARIERMVMEDEIDDDAGGMLVRLVRMAAAQTSALAVCLLDAEVTMPGAAIAHAAASGARQ